VAAAVFLFGVVADVTSLLYVQVPPDICQSEDKRSGVTEVEVVFALPTTADGNARPEPHAQVFAFLPVKAYGFRWAKGMFQTRQQLRHYSVVISSVWI
jgi:hypothetical protein